MRRFSFRQKVGFQLPLMNAGSDKVLARLPSCNAGQKTDSVKAGLRNPPCVFQKPAVQPELSAPDFIKPSAFAGNRRREFAETLD
jgi:hypothetical protein